MEVSFGRAMWAIGLRYRKHYQIMGRPDFAIPKYKIAIFCDSEFWHGYNWRENKGKIKSRKDYWIPKIERNIKRDKAVNRLLNKQGWVVIRFWEFELNADVNACVKKVKDTMLSKSEIKEK